MTAQRGVDAQHPLNRLAPERLLRWRLEQAAGAARASPRVAPAQPPVPRPNVKDRVPCTAIGWRDDGSTVLLVCSVGVDLDLVPYAIDARLAALVDERNEPGVAGEVWLVLPPRDLVPVTAELASLADQTLSLVPFSG